MWEFYREERTGKRNAGRLERVFVVIAGIGAVIGLLGWLIYSF